MKTYRLARDGARALRFRGLLLGSGSFGSGGSSGYPCDWTRWEVSTIYRTAAGAYVLEHETHSQWQGERGTSAAVVCATPEDLLAELGGMDRDEFGAAQLEAWNDACDKDPKLQALRCEEIA